MYKIKAADGLLSYKVYTKAREIGRLSHSGEV